MSHTSMPFAGASSTGAREPTSATGSQDVGADDDIGAALQSLAHRRPGAPALHAPGRRPLTFAGVVEQMARNRRTLARWDIGRGNIVASVILRRPEMAAACITLPDAATLAPLDPGFDVDTCCALLERLKPRAVILDGHGDYALRAAARRCGIAEIDLVAHDEEAAGTFELLLTREADSLHGPRARRPEIAYVMTTSGTTGRPKLVPSTHAQTCRRSRTESQWLGTSFDDVALHSMPMHLGHGMRAALMIPLLSGTSIVCLPQTDVEAFYAAFETFAPTCASAGFAFHRALLRAAAQHGAKLRGNRMRYLRFGSGPLRDDEINAIEQAFGAPLLAGLSSTEACGISLDPLPPRARKRGGAGLPIDAQIAMVDEAGRFLPPGQPGELVVRGPLVFDGYLDDDALTERSFIDDWFRTGDLCYQDADGYVFVTGRIKDLVNRGGVKISPLQVDQALEALAGVAEAASFAIPHPTLGEELIAAVVRAPACSSSESDLLAAAREAMSAERAPRRIVFVDRIPRGTAGKPLRRALAEAWSQPSETRDSSDARSDSAPSPVQERLAALWCKLLGVARIDPRDDFFLLGGDSLTGAQLVAQVRRIFGVDLRMRMLFDVGSTVAGMARAIEAAGAKAADDEVSNSVTATPAPDASTRHPLSPSQQRLWFVEQLSPAATAYNETRARRLVGELDVDALRRAIGIVVQRHEILRTRLVIEGGQPWQVVDVRDGDALAVTDYAMLPPTQRDIAVARAIEVDRTTPFDLQTGPLLRIALLRTAANEHLLLRTWHHVISDGWSAALFEREVAEAYNALRAGREPKLAPLAMQYKDYAAWQRQRLSPERVAAEVAFWKAQLDGCEPVPLLTDRARPSIQSHRGDMIAVPLAPDTGDAVRRLATASGATPFMVLLAVFLVLLHRYSGATDIAVGTPIAARRRVEFEGLLGFFANMLVMRADLSGDPPFARFLESVREVALRGYDHAEVPFDTLVKELVAERDASRNPLFQIAFALEPAHRPALPLDGIEVQRMPLTTGHAKFDLTLTLRGQASQLVAEWEFSSALFDRATIQRMAACYATLLASALRDPQQRIGTIPMTMPDERRRILEQWSGAGTPWPAGFASIARKFDDQVARCPAAIALIHDSRTVTYAALDRRAIQLCAWMRMHGAAPGGVVGVAGDGSPEMVIAWLAVMKSGAAYLPLDPELPKQRLAFMIEDAGACLLVGTTGMLASMPATTLPVIDVERDVARIDECPVDDPGVACDQDALGCILYTSGSTGQPKGVMVRQSSIVRLVTANDYVELGPGDTVARIANVGFDAATFEIWGALLNGARLAHLSRNQALSAAAFANAIDAYGVTCALVTTAVFNAMLRERPNVFAKVDKLLFGGEACDTEAVRRAFTGGAPRRLVNLYGPTEATTIATYHVVDHAPGDKPVPIGRPIRGTEVFVLDAQLQPVPPDVPGEIYIGGTGVALGYVGNPAATRERFVDHPFAPGSGRRLFRTGDIARWDADGILRFVGRCDDQVKIRGVRIEPGEVRGALQRLPGVRAAHVVVHTSPSGERCLVAYVVAHDASNVSPDTLSAALASSLPRYMVPLAFVMVDTLPLTRNGKIDTHALPSPTLDSRSTRGHVAPRDDVERAICAVWESLLGLERVGLEDDFFECGGHSLLAVRMLIRLGAIADGLTVSVVFEAPTVRALAERCREHRQLASRETATSRAM